MLCLSNANGEYRCKLPPCRLRLIYGDEVDAAEEQRQP